MDEVEKPKRNVSREPNDCKYIQVADPVSKERIFEICKTPDAGNQYTFWTRTSCGDWGITIKSIAKSAKGKSNSSDVNWKCTWVYNAERAVLYPTPPTRTLLQSDKIEGEQAENLRKIYEIYKKAD